MWEFAREHFVEILDPKRVCALRVFLTLVLALAWLLTVFN